MDKAPTEGTRILGLGEFDCILHLWLGVGVLRILEVRGCPVGQDSEQLQPPAAQCLPWNLTNIVAQFLLVNQLAESQVETSQEIQQLGAHEGKLLCKPHPVHSRGSGSPLLPLLPAPPPATTPSLRLGAKGLAFLTLGGWAGGPQADRSMTLWPQAVSMETEVCVCGGGRGWGGGSWSLWSFGRVHRLGGACGVVSQE